MKTQVLNFFRNIFKISVFESFLVKRTIEADTRNFFSKLVPQHYQYKKGSVRIAERNGIRYHFDLSDIVDWHLYFGFKDEGREVLFSKVSKGDTVIDVGANVGDTLMNFAKSVGEEGLVFGFEPDKNNFRRLTKNISLNDSIKNMMAYNIGLGDEEGEYLIKMNETEPGNAGSKRIIGASKSDSPNEMKVIVKKLDDYMEHLKVTKVDFIKMDIEGFELKALKGAIGTIKKYKPMLFLELHDVKLREQGSDGNQLLNFLEDLGYSSVNVDTNQAISIGSVEHGDHFDIVCSYS